MNIGVSISGPTAAGKTTLALALSHYLGWDIFRASSDLLASFDAPKKKEDRLRSWVSTLSSQELCDSSVQREEHATVDLAIDQHVIALARNAPGPMIFESLTLPLLLGKANPLFHVLLLASPQRRAHRLSERLPDLTCHELLEIVERKDHRTLRAIERAWNITLYDQRTFPSYDLIIEEAEVPEDQRLTFLQVQQVVIAAIDVYRRYQECAPSSDIEVSCHLFRCMKETISPHIRFFHPFLASPPCQQTTGGENLFSPQLWSCRNQL